MPKNGKNGTKVMTFAEMQEVMSYLLQQDAKHETRFTKIEQQIARNDGRYQKRVEEMEARFNKRVDESEARLNKRVDEAEKRFNKQIKQVLRINAEATKLLAENTEILQTAQLNLMTRTDTLEDKFNQLIDATNRNTERNQRLSQDIENLHAAQVKLTGRTEALEQKVDDLVDSINKLILRRDGKNGNGHKRPSSKK